MDFNYSWVIYVVSTKKAGRFSILSKVRRYASVFPLQSHGGEESIKHHPFFRDVKWKEMEERKIKPPFKPKIVSCFQMPFMSFNCN